MRIALSFLLLGATALPSCASAIIIEPPSVRNLRRSSPKPLTIGLRLEAEKAVHDRFHDHENLAADIARILQDDLKIATRVLALSSKSAGVDLEVTAHLLHRGKLGIHYEGVLDRPIVPLPTFPLVMHSWWVTDGLLDAGVDLEITRSRGPREVSTEPKPLQEIAVSFRERVPLLSLASLACLVVPASWWQVKDDTHMLLVTQERLRFALAVAIAQTLEQSIDEELLLDPRLGRVGNEYRLHASHTEALWYVRIVGGREVFRNNLTRPGQSMAPKMPKSFPDPLRIEAVDRTGRRLTYTLPVPPGESRR